MGERFIRQKNAVCKLALGIFVTLASFFVPPSLQATEDSGETGSTGNLEGSVGLHYGYTDVSGNRSQFREDNWTRDANRGGLEELNLLYTPNSDDEYQVEVKAKAISDDSYAASYLAKKPNHYFKTDFTGFRHYYGNTAGLATSAPAEDPGLHKDRHTYQIEFGVSPTDDTNVILSWHRLSLDGSERTLHGVSTSFSGPYDILGQMHQKGITDSFSGELSYRLLDKYNFKFLSEYEIHSDERTDVVVNSLPLIDENDYHQAQQSVLFDSFLDENSYLTANYAFYDLKNTSRRNVFTAANVLSLSESHVDAKKRGNILFTRFNRKKFLNQNDLMFDASLRAEYSELEYESDSFRNTSTYQTTGASDTVRLNERIWLTYKGISRTTLFGEAKLEQGFEDRRWKDRRIGTSVVDRDTDIGVDKQIYSIKAVHKLSLPVKLTMKGRYKKLKRDYDERTDSTASDYPGVFGTFSRSGVDVSWKADAALNSRMFSTLLYQWKDENIKTDLGGTVGKVHTHRAFLSLSYTATDHLFLTGTGMYEYDKLATPVDSTFASWAPGQRPYNFRGDSYTVLLNGTYTFDPDNIAYLSLRHTEAMGFVDFAGDYSLDRADVTFKHKLSSGEVLELAYHSILYNTDNRKFDDYRSHGIDIHFKRYF